MRLSKKNQRSLAALFVAAGLLGVFVITHSVVQILAGVKAAGEEHERAIGVMSTSSYVLGSYGADKVQPIVVIEGSESEPEILAKPISVLLYSEAENFAAPDHWGFEAFKWSFYFRSALLVAMIGLLMGFAWNTLRGSRSGNIFTHTNLRIMYALAPITFVFMLVDSNVYLFKQVAISELYADKASIALRGAFTLNTETLLVPLLLLAVAVLYKVAVTLNEEEQMTV